MINEIENYNQANLSERKPLNNSLFWLLVSLGNAIWIVNVIILSIGLREIFLNFFIPWFTGNLDKDAVNEALPFSGTFLLMFIGFIIFIVIINRVLFKLRYEGEKNIFLKKSIGFIITGCLLLFILFIVGIFAGWLD